MKNDYLLFQVNDIPVTGCQTIYVKGIIDNQPVFTPNIKEAMRLDLLKSVLYALKFGLSPMPAN